MIYCFDIDNTLCTTNGNDYENSKPIGFVIEEINRLYDQGNTIKIFTARGCVSKVDHAIFTKNQLKKWGVLYHELIMNHKPHFDLLIDDRCINVDRWKKKLEPKYIGFAAGAFDLIHPGYIKMFKDAKTVCNHLVVGLQTDPTIDRPYKDKPIQNVQERVEILESIKYVDEVIIYETERDLYKLLKKTKPHVRILGSDYYGHNYVGNDLGIKIHWHQRLHTWSSTELKKKIYKDMDRKVREGNNDNKS